MATRADAVAHAAALWDDGAFLDTLREMVAVPTESQEPTSRPALRQYLDETLTPRFKAMDHRVQVFDNPAGTGAPILVADRIEDPSLPTVLTYGHGDVVRGLADLWREGLEPWRVTVEGDKVYGRGTVDNKGQHAIAMAGLATVLQARGKLGFNSKFIVETAEEIGSGGLRPFLEQQKDLLAADVFVGLDGPRHSLSRPDMKLGCRGGVAFDLVCSLREGSHHSGHWGGVLQDPGFILGHALATIVSPKGRILVPGWTPERIPNSVRAAIADMEVEKIPGMPEADPDWGEPGLSADEKALAWTSVIVLAFKTGTPERPVNAVQGEARARLQIRHTVDVDPKTFLPNLRKHLDAHGFEHIAIDAVTERDFFEASRTEPDHPWVKFIARSLETTTGLRPNIIPNSGGSNPNQMFIDVLGTPTIWIPNSYSGCGQHGPDEHGLAPLYRQGLEMMAGLYWDIGAGGTPGRA